MTTRATARTRPSLRILLGAVIAMGPGKADLLEAIARTGSISAAAKEMGMSYRRAWMLVDTMNRCFRTPLIDAATGGSRGGGASLTPLGEEALARYREMEAHAVAAINAEVQAFQGLLRARAKTSRKS
jgi:molybdate transport system regulatory protein